MSTERPHFAIRVLPSLTDLAFLMPLVYLFGRMGGVKALLVDSDTGWHIRTGDWILAHRCVPTHDFFSYSNVGASWCAWEWLSDVILAVLNSRGGLATVILGAALLLAITFALLFRLVRRKANPIVAIAVTMLAAAGSTVHWLPRPHLFTLLFAVLFCAGLERMRRGQMRFAGVPVVVLLPVAMVLWTNLHGGFIVGLAIVAAYGVGEALRAVLSPEDAPRRSAWIASGRYFATALACLAASLINPYTWHLHAHLWKYLSDPWISEHVEEFFTLSFRHPAAIFFEGMLLLAGAAAFWHASRRSFIEPVLLLMWAHASLLAGRNIPIFMIVAAVPVAGAIDCWVRELAESASALWLRGAARELNRVAVEMAAIDGIPRWHLASAAGGLLVAALLFAPAPPPAFRAEYDPKAFPAAAVEVLRQDPSARIFTSDVWAGYLIYRLYPGIRVFMDGRSDFYGSEFSEKYVNVLAVKYDWEKTLDGYGVDTILLPTSTPLAGALKESKRWRVTYDDGVALLFRSARATGGTISAARSGGGIGRDREITKTGTDQAITKLQPTT